jgi:hypothetical protein
MDTHGTGTTRVYKAEVSFNWPSHFPKLDCHSLVQHTSRLKAPNRIELNPSASWAIF